MIIYDDEKLIEESIKGNKSALNTLLSNNYGIVKGYIMKMTGSVEMTNDIVQETMLKAVLNINKYRPEAKFSTWLITIATNTYRDMLRKNKKLSMEEFAYDNKDVCDGIEENILSQIELKKVYDVLLSIPYEKRAAFILKHYYGYKYDEISKILKCPEGTVKSRVFNCITNIVEKMKDWRENE